jgi:hypothetical protein
MAITTNRRFMVSPPELTNEPGHLGQGPGAGRLRFEQARLPVEVIGMTAKHLFLVIAVGELDDAAGVAGEIPQRVSFSQ